MAMQGTSFPIGRLVVLLLSSAFFNAEAAPSGAAIIGSAIPTSPYTNRMIVEEPKLSAPGWGLPLVTWPAAPCEVWLKASSNYCGTKLVKGSGTQADPYIGAFDLIRSNLPAQAWIHLGPGVFWTEANWNTPAKTGQRWSGAGMGTTTVRRDRGFGLNRDQSIFWSYSDQVTLEDMTLDANGARSDVWQRNGCDLWGSFNTVRRVEVINATGCWTNHAECFPIFVGWSNYTTGNVISECRVRQPAGDYITGISLNGGGWVDRCVAELPTAYGNCCFQGSCINGATFTLNTSLGGFYGYYSDWGSDTNLTLAFNDFSRSSQAVVITKGSTNWVTVGFRSIGNRGAVDQN